MKRILYILSAVATIFAGCTKDEIINDIPATTRQVTVRTLPEYAMANEPKDITSTRGTAICDRYIIEVYSDENCTTAVNVFDNGTKHQATTTTGQFSMPLNADKTYYCLFWADRTASEVYDVTSLKAVKLHAGEMPVEAFQGRLAIAGGETSYEVSLTRAVAKVSLKETSKLAEGMIKMKFNQKSLFNVATGVTEGEGLECNTIIGVPQAVTATDGNPISLNELAPVYLLAAAATTQTVEIIFNSGHESEWTLRDIRVQANYNTNIKGHYVTIPVSKAGSFYYADNTCSSEYKANTDNPCIGIVFWIDPANPGKGKIVSLDQGLGIWGPNDTESQDVEGINSEDDGATATRNLISVRKGNANFKTSYEAFYWIYQNKNKGDVNGRWYLPALNELRALYGTFKGGTPVDNKVMAAVNASLSKIPGAVKLDEKVTVDHWYWSSTQDSSYSASMFRFNDGGSMSGGKDGGDCSFRAISAF